MKKPCVYILASKRNGTLYVGVTSDVVARVWRHKRQSMNGFSEKYKVTMLVWYELHAEMRAAITREKQIKEWRREWKLRLIETINPDWRDLFDEVSR